MSQPPLRIPAPWLPELMTAALAWRGIREDQTPGPAWESARAILARVGDHLPLFLLLDLDALLRQSWEAPFNADQDPSANKPLRLRYEHEILARLLQDDIIEALRRRGADKDPLRRRLALRFLARRLAPLYPRLIRVNPAELRGLNLPPHDPESIRRADAILKERCGRELFAQGLGAFLEAAADDEAWCRPASAAELFELQHARTLSSSHARVGCRQIIELDSALGPADPRGFIVRDDEAAEAETAFVDDSHFPSGGFSELTRRGSLENLVKSELVYMDDGELSLFDLRAAEGELLYYLRDSGALLRRRRVLLFVIDAPRLYHEKSPRYPGPYSTLILTLCRRLTRDLLAIYQHDAVISRILFRDHPKLDLPTEQAILALLLAEERAARLAHIQASKDDGLEQHLPHDHLPRIIVFADDRSRSWRRRLDELIDARPGARGLVVGIGGAEGDLRLPSTGLSTAGLRKIRDALLESVVSGDS